jgi:hypothetical protein
MIYFSADHHFCDSNYLIYNKRVDLHYKNNDVTKCLIDK